jgi:hypothetical protein
MTKRIQHVVASYDIHDPKRLNRVAKIMKNYGERVLRLFRVLCGYPQHVVVGQ